MSSESFPTRSPQPAFAGRADESGALSRRLVGDDAAAVRWPSQRPRITTTSGVAAWLAAHRDETIVRDEWPAVAEAWRLASSGQSHALVELDRAWGMHARPGEASLRVGQRQLARLRPLRDARVVQRYLEAIADDRAHGWHPVVFGVWLAVFGVPLRQGLVQYAEQILGGLLDSVPGSAAFPAAEHERVRTSVVGEIPARLAEFLPASRVPLRALS